MSQENVRRSYQSADAFNRRDLDAFLSFCHPDIEFIRASGRWRVAARTEVTTASEADGRTCSASRRTSRMRLRTFAISGTRPSRVSAIAAVRLAARHRWSKRSGTWWNGATEGPSGGALAQTRRPPSKPPGCGSRHSRLLNCMVLRRAPFPEARSFPRAETARDPPPRRREISPWPGKIGAYDPPSIAIRAPSLGARSLWIWEGTSESLPCRPAGVSTCSRRRPGLTLFPL
jgi:hypothetical protein